MPALYELMAEIAPAPKSSGSVRKYRPKQFVLGYRALTEWPVRKDSKSTKGSEVIWEAALINKASLKAEVDALLEDGRGRLYIRRGDAKDKQVLRQAQRHLEDHYDYAWSPRPSAKAGGKGRKQRYTHRRLKRCGKLISGNDEAARVCVSVRVCARFSMKRKASRAAPYERPTKMTKHSTTTTVSRNLSTLRRTVTSTRPSMAPARWPSNLVPTRRTPKESTANPSMAPVKWPTLVPTTRTPKGGTIEEVEVASEEVAETSVTD
nr:hypothetical protein BaRGS_017303 [Batillaria attramentaria]